MLRNKFVLVAASLLSFTAQGQTADKTVVEYANLGASQDTFVQAIAKDYASFYDKKTAAKIVSYFTQKSSPTDRHAGGVSLVNYALNRKLDQPNGQNALVGDSVANVIISKFGMPPNRPASAAQPRQ